MVLVLADRLMETPMVGIPTAVARTQVCDLNYLSYVVLLKQMYFVSLMLNMANFILMSWKSKYYVVIMMICFIHVGYEAGGAWWMVDLVGSMCVGKVSIYSRTDCCGE